MIDYNKYLNGKYDCDCGNTHIVPTKKIVVERDAIKRIPELLNELSLPKDIFCIFY